MTEEQNQDPPIKTRIVPLKGTAYMRPSIALGLHNPQGESRFVRFLLWLDERLSKMESKNAK